MPPSETGEPLNLRAPLTVIGANDAKFARDVSVGRYLMGTRVTQSILTTTFGPLTATAGINVSPVTGTVIKDGVSSAGAKFSIVKPDLPGPCIALLQAMVRVPAASLTGGVNAMIGLAAAGTVEILEFSLDRLGILPMNAVGTSDVENYFTYYVEYPAHTPGEIQAYIGANDGVPAPTFPGARASSIIVAGAWGRAYLSLYTG